MSETEEGKICPMISKSDPESREKFFVLDCQKEKCAWWTDKRCAVAAIAAQMPDPGALENTAR